MLNVGPSGFYKAPVSKVYFIVVACLSIFNSLFSLSPKNVPLLVHPFVFTCSTEILLGGFLLYMTRMFERHFGSSKFIFHLFIVITLSTFIQYIFKKLLLAASSSGPYGIIYACMVYYMVDIPQSYSHRLFHTISINNKIFALILAAQLVFQDGWRSTLAALSGLIAGFFYRSNILNMKTWRFPRRLRNICKIYLLPVIETATSETTVHSSSQLRTAIHPFPNSTANMDSFPMPSISEEHIQLLMNMGFDRDQVMRALLSSHNDIQRASNFLLDQ